jgi:hypothetical protein
VPILLKAWIDTFGKRDLELYDILRVEKEMNIKLPGTGGKPFLFTTRPDTVVRQKRTPREYFIMETKTSSFSINVTDLGVRYGDQATSYIASVEENLGIRVAGVIPDIAYWNKQAKSEGNISCVRGDLITRSPSDVAQFKNATNQVFVEMSQKATAVLAGQADPRAMFARNTYYCNAFNKSCEFCDICRRPDVLIGRGSLPPEFVRDATPQTVRRLRSTAGKFIDDSASGAVT